jgi:hypothetical protein
MFAIALFAGVDQSAVQPEDSQPRRVGRDSRQFEILDDKRCSRCWSPTRYADGATSHGNAGVAGVSALVFDLDRGPPDPKRLAGVCWIGQTTWSHTPEAPRWRVVVPLAAARAAVAATARPGLRPQPTGDLMALTRQPTITISIVCSPEQLAEVQARVSALQAGASHRGSPLRRRALVQTGRTSRTTPRLMAVSPDRPTSIAGQPVPRLRRSHTPFASSTNPTMSTPAAGTGGLGRLAPIPRSSAWPTNRMTRVSR